MAPSMAGLFPRVINRVSTRAGAARKAMGLPIGLPETGDTSGGGHSESPNYPAVHVHLSPNPTTTKNNQSKGWFNLPGKLVYTFAGVKIAAQGPHPSLCPLPSPACFQGRRGEGEKRGFARRPKAAAQNPHLIPPLPWPQAKGRGGINLL